MIDRVERLPGEAERPLFTVIVPVHNGARFVRDALESVSRQSLHAWECVLVDDASTDDSIRILEEWAAAQVNRVEIVRIATGPLGAAAARNTAVRNARAPWLAFLDQDDYWLTSKLEVQANYLIERPDVAAVSTLPALVYENVEEVPFIESWRRMMGSIAGRDLSVADFLATCPYCLSATAVRRRELLDAGGFNEALPQTSDWLMWACLASRGPIGILDSELTAYRIHGKNSLLALYGKPMGVVYALLEVHEHLVEWIAMDRGADKASVRSWVNRLFAAQGGNLANHVAEREGARLAAAADDL